MKRQGKPLFSQLRSAEDFYSDDQERFTAYDAAHDLTLERTLHEKVARRMGAVQKATRLREGEREAEGARYSAAPGKSKSPAPQ